MLTIRCQFHPRVTKCHVKDSGHSAKIQVAGYTYTHITLDPTKSDWADNAAFQT